MMFLKNKGYYQKVLLAGGMLLVLAIIAALNFGVANISVKQCLAIIFSKVPFLNNLAPVEQLDKSALIIVLKLRLPRIVLATLVGAGLAVAASAAGGSSAGVASTMAAMAAARKVAVFRGVTSFRSATDHRARAVGRQRVQTARRAPGRGSGDVVKRCRGGGLGVIRVPPPPRGSSEAACRLPPRFYPPR